MGIYATWSARCDEIEPDTEMTPRMWRPCSQAADGYDLRAVSPSQAHDVLRRAGWAVMCVEMPRTTPAPAMQFDVAFCPAHQQGRRFNPNMDWFERGVRAAAAELLRRCREVQTADGSWPGADTIDVVLDFMREAGVDPEGISNECVADDCGDCRKLGCEHPCHYEEEHK